MIFSTPLTCHQHSMLVYPALTKHLQHDWDQLLSEYTDEQITEKVFQLLYSHCFELHLLTADILYNRLHLNDGREFCSSITLV